MKSCPFIAYCCLLAIIFATACDKKNTPATGASTLNSLTTGRYLYVASGSCYGGGVTTSSPSSTIVRYDADTGTYADMIWDYNTSSPGDNPVALANYDNDHLMVLIENASGRRIDLLNKNGSGVSSYLTNSTALNSVVRSLVKLSDGSLLVSKSSAVEKFSAAKARITIGGNPYVNAPGSSCATSTTLISWVTTLSNGKILFTHAAATPNNKFGIISSTGYSGTTDCLSTQAAPTTTALPTVAIRHSSGQTLVGYGSTTLLSNFVYAYDIDENTNIISGTTAAFNDATIVNGPSAMIEDTSNGAVFIANANNTFNTVEKFNYNSTTKTLTKSTSAPFIGSTVFTKCVSGLLVAN